MQEIHADPKTPVAMKLILEKLGVSDTAFCMCAMRGAKQSELDKIQHGYMLYVFEGLSSFLPDQLVQYSYEFKAVRKRCQGINRPHLVEKAYKVLKDMRHHTVDRQERHALMGMMMLASPHPDYLATTHAAICLMDAGGHSEVEPMLRKKLEELL